MGWDRVRGDIGGFFRITGKNRNGSLVDFGGEKGLRVGRKWFQA